jgi:membrane protein YdbS with pleckstrin-like domain
MSERQAQGRWMTIVGVRLAGAAGAMLGLVLIARAYAWPQKALGVAIVLSALLLIAVVPRALAHRWRTPE